MLVVTGILVFLIAGFFWATATPGDPYDGPAASPEDGALAGRLERHVAALSERPRNLQNLASVRTALAYLDSELRGQGFEPRRQEVVSPAENLIVTIGARSTDAPVLIIGAHYDTAGASPGADDNASGVAGIGRTSVLAMAEGGPLMGNAMHPYVMHTQQAAGGRGRPPPAPHLAARSVRARRVCKLV